MRRVDIRKKQPTSWPWLAGAALLGLVGWGVTELLAPPSEEAGPEIGTTVADTQPPAAIPLVGRQPFYPPDRPGLVDLAPLGPEDAGESVRVHGQVVAADETGYWAADGGLLVRVSAASPVRPGDVVSADGRLRAADLTPPADLPEDSAGATPWTVVRELELVPDGATGPSGGPEP